MIYLVIFIETKTIQCYTGQYIQNPFHAAGQNSVQLTTCPPKTKKCFTAKYALKVMSFRLPAVQGMCAPVGMDCQQLCTVLKNRFLSSLYSLSACKVPY